MVRRSIANEVPLPHLRNGEDMAVIPLMIMRCSKFGIVDKCIYNYLCRPGSLSLSTRADVVSALEHSFAYIITNQVPGFELEIEFIGIKNLVYGGLLNHFKCQKNSLPASQLLDRFEQRYPQWKYNAYCKTLPLFKKIFMAPNPIPVKECLSKMGIIQNYVRRPLVELDELEKQDLYSILEQYI
jgi:hypothetical protein